MRRIENEGQQPNLDVLQKLSQAHGLDLEDYLAQVNAACFQQSLTRIPARIAPGGIVTRD